MHKADFPACYLRFSAQCLNLPFKIVDAGAENNGNLPCAVWKARPGTSMPSVESIQAIVDPLFPGLMGVRIVVVMPERVVAELPYALTLHHWRYPARRSLHGVADTLAPSAPC
jgi:hypothetical protein